MNGNKLDFDTREKRLVMCGIFALLLLLPFMAAVPGVLAKVADDIEDMLVKDITSMSGGIGTEIKTILLETKLSSSVTDAFSTGVKGVANVLFIFYMYCSLISEVQKGDPEMGMWLRFFCKVYVGFWCIENSGTLITIIQGLGEDVMNGVTLSTATAADIESKARTALDGVFTKPNGSKIGTIPAAVIFIRALPVILAGKVAVVAAKVVSFTLLIEEGICRVFLPIAVSNICGEGLRSPGGRFVKIYFAVYIRMAMVILIANFMGSFCMEAFNSLQGSDITAVTDSLINAVGVMWAGIAIMMRTNELGNAIAGA